ncbi:MAG: HAMP domain-containing histidine kinase [Deltaproteobacteria bacterium]|nr:HAMP domain-containing histidine kinase [Deltaproteobacteria bacterium]
MSTELEALLTRLVSESLQSALRAEGLEIDIAVRGDLSEDELLDALKRILDNHNQREKHVQRLVMLGTASAGLVHEVRNMLTAGKGYAQLGLRARNLDKTVGYFELIDQETSKAIDSLTMMLALSRNRPVHREPFDICEILRRTDRATRHQLELHNVALQTICPESEVLAFGSGPEIEQTVINLILNAQQAMTDGGKVVVKVSAEEAQTSISVSDDGPGIPRNARDQIFNPFYTTKKSGTGLGLSICKRIAEEHGGDLEFESEAGQGTTFTLTLPVHSEEVSEP